MGFFNLDSFLRSNWNQGFVTIANSHHDPTSLQQVTSWQKRNRTKRHLASRGISNDKNGCAYLKGLARDKWAAFLAMLSVLMPVLFLVLYGAVRDQFTTTTFTGLWNGPTDSTKCILDKGEMTAFGQGSCDDSTSTDSRPLFYELTPNEPCGV